MESTNHPFNFGTNLSAHASDCLPLIAVVGPTGAGKSQMGLELARSFNGAIVNCDSIQVYRDLDIGSAKVPPGERGGIPHYLIDVIDPTEELTAGAYAREARGALRNIGQSNKLPIIVGGTGFYLRALLDGLSPAPPRDNILRERLSFLAQRRPALLHRFVRRFDPPAAARIHPNDRQKLIRAIELTCLTGAPASAAQSLPRDALQDFRVLKIGLVPPRQDLYKALNKRTLQMFSQGLLPETEALLSRGVSPDAKALQSLGYKQAVAVLAGQQSFHQGIAECQTRTRQYAKRQLTWFRADSSVNWLAGFGWEAITQGQAATLVKRFLS